MEDRRQRRLPRQIRDPASALNSHKKPHHGLVNPHRRVIQFALGAPNKSLEIPQKTAGTDFAKGALNSRNVPHTASGSENCDEGRELYRVRGLRVSPGTPQTAGMIPRTSCRRPPRRGANVLGISRHIEESLGRRRRCPQREQSAARVVWRYPRATCRWSRVAGWRRPTIRACAVIATTERPLTG